jgi:hypothetical protein
MSLPPPDAASFPDFTCAELRAAATAFLEVFVDFPGELAEDLRTQLARLSDLTPAVETQDGLTGERLELERDGLASGLIRTIEAARRHPFTAKSQAAFRLWALCEHRAGSSEGWGSGDECDLKLLFADFDQAPAQSDLATLDLLTWYEKLRAAQAHTAAAPGLPGAVRAAKVRLVRMMTLSLGWCRPQADWERFRWSRSWKCLSMVSIMELQKAQRKKRIEIRAKVTP